MHTQHANLSRNDDYELFRRAIVERDADAWAESAARYRGLLMMWARNCSAAAQIGEYYGDIADQAFTRAWMALSPAHFGSFPNLAALLGYLRSCVTAVVIDRSRAQAAYGRMLQKLEVGNSSTPEEIVMDKLARAELWRLVSGVAANDQERVVLIESFVLDRKPRDILARHPELFADIMAVYNTKRNLLNRLQANRRVQELYQDMCLA